MLLRDAPLLEAAAQAEESHEIRECRVATGRSLHGALRPIAIQRYGSAERGEPTIPGKYDSRLDRHGITGPATASTAAEKVVDRSSFNPSVQCKRKSILRPKRIAQPQSAQI